MGLENVDLAVYYNRWRGVEIKGIGACFDRLEEKDYETISPGDELWVDPDPLHPNGKVYGFAKVKVSNVEDDPDGKNKRVHYSGRFVGSGFSNTCLGRFYQLTDTDALETLVAEHGDKMTDLFSSREKYTRGLFGL